MLSYRRKTALQGGLVSAKVEDWDWETIFYRHYRYIFNHCDSYRISRKKKQNKAYYAVQGHSRSSRSASIESQYATSDFLLVINSNYHPISYHIGDIAAYCSNFGHCVIENPLWGLGTTYDDHRWLIGKRVVDFLLVLIELFSLGVTAEAPYERK